MNAANKNLPDKDDLADKMRENLERAREDAADIEEKKFERDRGVKPSKFSPKGPAIAPDDA